MAGVSDYTLYAFYRLGQYCSNSSGACVRLQGKRLREVWASNYWSCSQGGFNRFKYSLLLCLQVKGLRFLQQSEKRLCYGRKSWYKAPIPTCRAKKIPKLVNISRRWQVQNRGQLAEINLNALIVNPLPYFDEFNSCSEFRTKHEHRESNLRLKFHAEWNYCLKVFSLSPLVFYKNNVVWNKLLNI